MSLGPITRLQSEHLWQLQTLLSGEGLPIEDCADRLGIFYGIFARGDLVAAGGLEPAAGCSLLRSIVVHHAYRGQGLARHLAEFMLAAAETRGDAAVYLLTETAAAYFKKLGFSPVARDRVPAAIRNTRQFSTLCPDNADCLSLMLPRRHDRAGDDG